MIIISDDPDQDSTAPSSEAFKEFFNIATDDVDPEKTSEEEIFYIDPNTVPRDAFHKSIHDQLSLIKQRNMDINSEVPTLTSEVFISKMEEMSTVRGELRATDSIDETEVVFENLLELKRQLDDLILHGKVDTTGNNLNRLINTVYIPVVRSSTPEPEIQVGFKEVVCTTITFSIVIVVLKLLLDWFSGE